MSLPSFWNTVLVRGRFLKIDGTPVSGRVIFTPKAGRLVLPGTPA